MREPPFVIPVPSNRYFLDDHCANCLHLLPEHVEALVCSSWCAEIAAHVRYMRRVYRDGRVNDSDVQEAIQIRNAFLLVGGYGALDRTLRPAVRAEVKVRDGGRCRQCGRPGAEIDHIAGSSGELENLQLLCAQCHRAKTAENMVPTTPHEQSLLRALFLTRVASDEPTLLGDDEVTWPSAWPSLKSARKKRARDARASALTTADPIPARDDDTGEYGPAMPRTVDDDSGYGPNSMSLGRWTPTAGRDQRRSPRDPAAGRGDGWASAVRHDLTY
jgi:5-methylcytosine-specific restriction endonuclease McrA